MLVLHFEDIKDTIDQLFKTSYQTLGSTFRGLLDTYAGANLQATEENSGLPSICSPAEDKDVAILPRGAPQNPRKDMTLPDNIDLTRITITRIYRALKEVFQATSKPCIVHLQLNGRLEYKATWKEPCASPDSADPPVFSLMLPFHKVDNIWCQYAVEVSENHTQDCRFRQRGGTLFLPWSQITPDIRQEPPISSASQCASPQELKADNVHEPSNKMRSMSWPGPLRRNKLNKFDAASGNTALVSKNKPERSASPAANSQC